MSDVANANRFAHFYEVALMAVHEYSREPRPDYLRCPAPKNNWTDINKLASFWAMDACQCQLPATVPADVSAFKAQLLLDDIIEGVMSRATERIFGRFNEDYLSSSTCRQEQVLRRVQAHNERIRERWGIAHSFLFMDDTSHRYILHAIDEECEVARQSGLTIDFDAIAEQMLFEVGRNAQEHFTHLALMAAEQYFDVERSDDVDQDELELGRQSLQNLATTFGLRHVDNCRPRALSADVSYFEHLFVDHDSRLVPSHPAPNRCSLIS